MAEHLSNTGQSFISALKNKYFPDDDECDPGLDKTCMIVVHTTRHRKSESGEVVLPAVLSLDSSSVSRAGSTAEFANALRHVRELDISKNVISQWHEVQPLKVICFDKHVHLGYELVVRQEKNAAYCTVEVFAIITEMSDIVFLNVSSNPLWASDPITWDLSIPAFSSIRQLVLNGTKLPWDAVIHLLDLLPALCELHLSSNAYKSVSVPSTKAFQGLTDLFLSSNELNSWSDVCVIGCTFPNLSNLVLIGNPLASIDESDNQCELIADAASRCELEGNTCFPQLKSLNISNTQLATWEELEKLNRLPCLVELRMTGIAFFESVEEELRRKLAISYLPRVNKLNGSVVTPDERETAQRAFLRHFMNAEQKPTRYVDLLSQIGHIDPLAEVSLAPRTSVRVTAHFDDRSIVQQFKLSMTAMDVKKILSVQLVGHPENTFDIYHHDVGSPFGHDIMKFMQKTLLSYRINDDDEIYVQMKQ